MTEFRPNNMFSTPPVVKNIIIINVLMVLIQYVLGKMGVNLTDILGLHYWKSHYFHWWQIITHIFMHGSPTDVGMTVEHIFFNMFALWMFGRMLEQMWGPKKFLFFYMVCGIGAAICHLIVLGVEFGAIEHAFHVYQQSPTFDHFNQFLQERVTYNSPALNYIRELWAQDPSRTDLVGKSIETIHHYMYGVHTSTIDQYGIFDEGTIGASGAVFGVLFAFGYMFPNTLLYIYFLVPIKAKWAVAGFALIELFMGVRNSAGDNIAHFAHLGGMLFAFILLKIWGNKYRDRYY